MVKKINKKYTLTCINDKKVKKNIHRPVKRNIFIFIATIIIDH